MKITKGNDVVFVLHLTEEINEVKQNVDWSISTEIKVIVRTFGVELEIPYEIIDGLMRFKIESDQQKLLTYSLEVTWINNLSEEKRYATRELCTFVNYSDEANHKSLSNDIEVRTVQISGELLNGLRGEPGKSAYESYMNAGGSLAESEFNQRLTKVAIPIVIENMYVFENISEDTSEMNSYLAPYGGFDAVRALLESGQGFMEVHSDGYRIRQVYFQNQDENQFMVAFVGSDDGTIPMIQVSIEFNKTTGWAISNEMILGSNSINNHKPIFRIYANPWELDKTKAQMDALLLSFGGFDLVKARLTSGNALLCCANGSIAIQCANYGTNKFSVLFIGADDGYFDSIVAVNVIFDKENGISIEDTYDIAYGNSSATSFSPIVLDFQFTYNTPLGESQLDGVTEEFAKHGGWDAIFNKIQKDQTFFITGIHPQTNHRHLLTPVSLQVLGSTPSLGRIKAKFVADISQSDFKMFVINLSPTEHNCTVFYGGKIESIVTNMFFVALNDGQTYSLSDLSIKLLMFHVSNVTALANAVSTGNAIVGAGNCYPVQFDNSEQGKLTLFYNKINGTVLETYKVVLEENVGINVTKLI